MTLTDKELAEAVQKIAELDEVRLPYKWEYDTRATFVLGRAENRYTRIAEVLGWGNLTCGRPLNFSVAKAEEIQNATGEFIAAAPLMASIIRQLWNERQTHRNLIKTLTDYSAHMGYCPTKSGLDCTCGFREAYKQASALIPPKD